jgi:lipoprotein-anchoring transpeptidase ErfK/SrfK
MIYSSQRRKKNKKLAFTTSLLIALLLMLTLSACGGSSSAQQQMSKNKAALDAAITQAQSTGVPASMLNPVQQQETKLSSTSAPITLLNDQPATDYYTNLAQRYQMLAVQVRGLTAQASQQLDYQLTLDLQTFASVLSQRQAEGFVEAKTFANQLTQDQKLQANAQSPKDFLTISASAKQSTQALRLMSVAYQNMKSFNDTIAVLQQSHLGVAALTQESQSDLQAFRTAASPEDFTQLIDQLNTQLNETTTYSTQAIPYVGAIKLKQLSSVIDQMKQYGLDTTKYQQELNTDQTSLNNAHSLADFLKVSSQVDTDVATIQLPYMQGKANYLLNQFHQEVTTWGKANQYHDSYDNNTYALDYEYDQQEGFGSDADTAVQSAQTVDDYQSAIDIINAFTTNLKAMETDAADKTPWNQAHATDMQVMQYYGVTQGQTLVISLIEQSLRVYQNGQLVKSFQIVSGQFAKPSPPGFWHIFDRESPTVFKSSEPKGSAFWYPNTNIQYAMGYHDGGYFFHDSWWRTYYGPGNNFPHYDPGGESFAGTGSHGCINMQPSDAGWLYHNTGYGTPVIIY